MQKRRKSRQYEQFFDVPEPSQPLIGFSAIAEHHYRSAVELLRQAENVCAGREWKVCFYVLSAICLFHASLECYINEELAVSLALLDKPPDHLVARCLALQDKTFSTEKLDGFLDAYGFREQFETAIIEDVTCLCNLRDRLYHHSPEMKPTNQYPEAAAVVLRKVGAAPINTSWTAAVSHLDVGEWARAVTQRFVETHCAAKAGPRCFLEDRPRGTAITICLSGSRAKGLILNPILDPNFPARNKVKRDGDAITGTVPHAKGGRGGDFAPSAGQR